MISVFTVFKVIFSLVIAGFVLAIALNFSSSLFSMGDSNRDASIMLSLRETFRDVYTTGIPSDINIPFHDKISYHPPVISYTRNMDMDPLPLLFSPGQRISVVRGAYDLGWWKFRFVYAAPSSRFIFSPAGTDDVVISAVGNITSLLPDTGNAEEKVYLGFGCNQTESGVVYYDLGWERNHFIDRILPNLAAIMSGSSFDFVPCEGEMEGYHFITVSRDPGPGFTVVPGALTRVYYETGGEISEHVCINPLEVLALKTGGEDLMLYMREKFLKGLETAADIAYREAMLLENKMGPECSPLYSDLLFPLSGIRTVLEEELDEEGMEDLAIHISLAREKFKTLEDEGCR